MKKPCKCPVCGGSGKWEAPAHLLPEQLVVDKMEIKRTIAQTLQSKGYSIRQIMKALDYKSPRSVQILLQ